MMGIHPPEAASLASMRAQTAQTLSLLWAGKWDVLKAAGLYAVFMALFIGVFVGEAWLFPADDGGDGRLETFATVFLFLAFAIPPLVLLHSLGHRARGATVAFRQSLVQTAKRMPRLLVFGLFAAVFCLSWLFVLYLAAGFLLAMPMILAITFRGEDSIPDVSMVMFGLYRVVSMAGLLAAGAILVRTALLAPLFILVDGLGVTEAWQRSSRAMSWKSVFTVLPLLAPCMAYVLAPLYFLLMYILPGAIWVYGFMTMMFVLPPVCLALALAASVLPWQGAHLAPPDAPAPMTPGTVPAPS